MAMGEDEAAEDDHLTLLHDSNSSSTTPLVVKPPINRTGTIRSTIAHIITAVIGSGVLSLAWSTAQLGWIGGPVALLCFAVVTYVSSSLLADCYRSPDSVTGVRNPSYTDAVRVNLGNNLVDPPVLRSWLPGNAYFWVNGMKSGTSNDTCGRKQTWISGLIQYVCMYIAGVAYVITTSTCMRAIQKSNCYHKEGHEAHCESGDNIYMLVFGGIQIVLSQIPDFHNIAWLSVVAAIMSFSYSFIGLALGFAQVIENKEIKGSIRGVPADTIVEKLWLTFKALGDIAFAYPYPIILLEIQDTVKSPPPENQTMKRASISAILITTFFYLGCGCFGYAAFGNDTPGNLLTGFGFYEPFWLIDFANACIVIHLIGGYQALWKYQILPVEMTVPTPFVLPSLFVYSQPVFAFAERWFTKKFPDNEFMTKFYACKFPFVPAFHLNLFRLCFRTAYVVTTTWIGMLFPYFNEILGVLGALNLWPLAVYFPVEMYFVQKKIGAWTRKWVVLQTFSMVCLLVTVVALIGSIEGLIRARTR